MAKQPRYKKHKQRAQKKRYQPKAKPQQAQVSTQEQSVPAKLFSKNYLLLWQGQLVSKLGTQVYMIAIIIWLKQQTESKTIVSLFSSAASLPLVVMAIFGGVVADRIARKKIIVGTDFISGAAMLTVAYLFFTTPVYNSQLLTGVFILAILVSAMQGFFGPAISAAIPDLVPQNRLAGANAMGKLSDSVSQFFGLSIGGFLYAVIGMPLIMLFNGLSFIFSAFSESFVKIPTKKRTSRNKRSYPLQNFKRDLKESLHYIRSNKGLNKLLQLSLISTFFSAGIMTLLIFYVTDYLQYDEKRYALFLIISGIGSLIGSVLAGILNLNGNRRRNIVLLLMMMQALGYAALVQVNQFIPAIILFTLGGFIGGFNLVNIHTIMQIIIPSEIRGRVFGSLTTLSGAFGPLGMALGGIIADQIGLEPVFTFSGLTMFLLIILFAFNKDLRAILAYKMIQTQNKNEH